MGPPKTLKQWKEVLLILLHFTTISEMKTVVRRAREVRYGHTGTGGGAAKKPLTDLEERLLALISKVTVEGVDLVEAGGLNTDDDNLAMTTNEYICNLENNPSADESNITVSPLGTNEIIIEKIVLKDNVSNSPHLDESILKKNHPIKTDKNRIGVKKLPLRKGRNRGNTEENRVNVGLKMHDANLHDFTLSNYAIAQSINSLAKSINMLARKLK